MSQEKKRASMATFSRLHVYSIHVITAKMTLAETSVHVSHSYRHIDLRTATMPDTWGKRKNLLEARLKETHAVTEPLKRECVGIAAVHGPTVDPDK
ncbi:hypothetical protein BC940DRAFT_335779 [Gongronella butleri]|nr:hypothetical protein BC940DRAFT_335779 [Gongronella butleri]